MCLDAACDSHYLKLLGIPHQSRYFCPVDQMGVDIFGVDITGVDILEEDILALNCPVQHSGTAKEISSK